MYIVLKWKRDTTFTFVIFSMRRSSHQEGESLWGKFVRTPSLYFAWHVTVGSLFTEVKCITSNTSSCSVSHTKFKQPIVVGIVKFCGWILLSFLTVFPLCPLPFWLYCCTVICPFAFLWWVHKMKKRTVKPFKGTHWIEVCNFDICVNVFRSTKIVIKLNERKEEKERNVKISNNFAS